MKTAKYSICFDAIDTELCKEISLSKKEYERQMGFLLSQLLETAQNEYPMQYRSRTDDYESVTVTRHIFTVGTADTTLTAMLCKPGYHFK